MRVSTGTQPYHRVSDDAEFGLRHTALCRLLLRKNVISEDEYEEEVRLLMKEHDEDA